MESLKSRISNQSPSTPPIPRHLLFCKTNPISFLKNNQSRRAGFTPPQSHRQYHPHPFPLRSRAKIAKQTQFQEVKVRAKSCNHRRLSQITRKEQTEKTNPISSNPRAACLNLFNLAVPPVVQPRRDRKTNPIHTSAQNQGPGWLGRKQPSKIQTSDNTKKWRRQK